MMLIRVHCSDSMYHLHISVNNYRSFSSEEEVEDEEEEEGEDEVEAEAPADEVSSRKASEAKSVFLLDLSALRLDT